MYSTEELAELQAKIHAALTDGRLDAWQTEFLSDISGRFRKDGRDTELSPKQRLKLYEILVAEEGRNRPANVLRYRARRHHRRRSVFHRESRWFVRRFTRDLVIIAAILLCFAIFAAVRLAPWSDWGHFFVAASPSHAAVPISRSAFSVTDGDTIHVFGEPKGLRLVGFNAPESIEPRCDAERALGLRASARLKELVASSDLTLERIPCSCPPGTEGTYACNYGRSCGILRADGRNVGDILIAEGLAVPFACFATRCPSTPRPWCG